MSITDKNISKLQKEADKTLKSFDRGYAYILSQLDTNKGGQLLFNEDNLNYIGQNFDEEFDEIIAESGYEDLIDESLSKDKDTIEYLTKEYGLVFAAGSIATISAYQKLVKQEMLGLLISARESLKQQLISEVSLNNTYKKTLEVGIDKLKVMVGDYSKTYITTSKTILEQKILDITNKDVDEWEYVGPNDGVTRPQCLRGLEQQYFTTEEKDQFQSESVRYNCRHLFVPKKKK